MILLLLNFSECKQEPECEFLMSCAERTDVTFSRTETEVKK